MKIFDQFFILKRHFVKKENVVIISVLALIFIAIFTCLTMINFATFFRTSMIKSRDSLILFIDKTDDEEKMELLNNIDHIISVENKKYAIGVEVFAPQFDNASKNKNEDMEGIIQLKPLLNASDVKIEKGENLKKNGDIICSSNLYPYSLYVGETYDGYEIKMYKSLIRDSKKLIGQTINLINNEDIEYKFNIVGSFYNNLLEESNVCYISKEDFDLFKSNYEVCSDEECYEYHSLMLRIDEYKNIDEVEKKLKDIGFIPTRYYTFDDESLDTLTYIPLFISSIIIIISITIIYNFFRKKSVNNQYQHAILRSIGYTKSNILSISIIEGLIIYLICLIISIIGYLIGYNIVTYFYLDQISYINFYVPIPWFYILLFSIFILGYIFLVIREFVKRNLNLYIDELFRK